MSKLYKIRNINTGEFAVASGHWTKNGKTWSSIGYVKSHLNLTSYKAGDAEVVEYELTEVSTQPLPDLIKQHQAEKIERENKSRVSNQQRNVDAAEQRLAKAKSDLEKASKSLNEVKKGPHLVGDKTVIYI